MFPPPPPPPPSDASHGSLTSSSLNKTPPPPPTPLSDSFIFKEYASDEDPDPEDAVISQPSSLLLSHALRNDLSGRPSVICDSTFLEPPKLPSKPRPTIAYAREGDFYRPHTKPSFAATGSMDGSLDLASAVAAGKTLHPPSGSPVPPAPSTWPSQQIMEWDSDSPQYAKNLAALKAHCTRFSNRLHRDHVSLGPECLCTSPVALLHYSETLQQATGSSGVVDGAAVARLINQVSELRVELRQRLQGACKAEEDVFERVKAAEDKYARFEDQRSKHVEKLRQYLQKTSDSKKLYEKSIKLNAMQQYLELERYGLYSSLAQVYDNMEYALVQPLAERLAALSDFFAAGAALLAPYKDIVATVSSRAQELEQTMVQNKARYETLGKEVERMAGDVFQVEEKPTNSGFGLAQLLGRDKKEKDKEKDKDKEDGYGIRDLENRKKTHAASDTKKGYLYLPLRDCERVWVEVCDDEMVVWDALKVERIHTLPLLLSTVKQQRDNKLRYVLAVITPQNTVLLQAESEVAQLSWIDSIQTAIGRCLNKNDVPKGAAEPQDHYSAAGAAAVVANMLTKRLSTIQFSSARDDAEAAEESVDDRGTMARLWSVPGNEACADCGAPQPEWISLNLGVVMCLECSSAHRMMGVDTSKVRSGHMDVIDEHVEAYIMGTGNSLANQVFLALPCSQSITPDTLRAERAAYIKDKYQNRKWMRSDALVAKLGGPVALPPIGMRRQETLDALLLDSIRQGDVGGVYDSLMQGANVDTTTPGNEGRNAAHEAMMYADPRICAAVCMRALDLTAKDERGWTPLHYAAYANKGVLVDMCVAFAGSGLTAVTDHQGRTARQVAEECNVGPEYAAELPRVLSALQKAEQKYQQRLAKNAQ